MCLISQYTALLRNKKKFVYKTSFPIIYGDIFLYTYISIWSFWSYRRYARCWWHLTLHIINIEKNVSRLLFHFFFFLICVYIPWAWLGWRWCGCVLMYCSLFRNFTFCFYWFLFYFGLLVYICVVGVFL